MVANWLIVSKRNAEAVSNYVEESQKDIEKNSTIGRTSKNYAVILAGSTW